MQQNPQLDQSRRDFFLRNCSRALVESIRYETFQRWGVRVLCQPIALQIAEVEVITSARLVDWTVQDLYSVRGDSCGGLHLRGQTGRELLHSPLH